MPFRRRGFTLVEILIVVIIIGVLAAIVIPVVSNAQEQARQAEFQDTLRKLTMATQHYLETNSSLPTQGAGDPIPAEVYVNMYDNATFPNRTPLGGYWHLGFFADVNEWGVGVWWPSDETGVEDKIVEIDVALDDGDKNNGKFQARNSARYYWLLRKRGN